jgi:hypothetical protein
MTAGYSGTPLAKKLGLKSGQATLLLNIPEGLVEISAFAGFASVETRLPAVPARQFDYVHVFGTQRMVLEEMAKALFQAIKPGGIVWISWPKKSSKVATDITEDVLREILLPTGLVDIKVCAIDETWSGLKFVIRKELRGSL